MALLNLIFLFGANQYKAKKTIKNTIEETTQRNVFQNSIKSSDNPTKEKKYKYQSFVQVLVIEVQQQLQ